MQSLFGHSREFEAEFVAHKMDELCREKTTPLRSSRLSLSPITTVYLACRLLRYAMHQ